MYGNKTYASVVEYGFRNKTKPQKTELYETDLMIHFSSC
jgi:hypothetical protein